MLVAEFESCGLGVDPQGSAGGSEGLFEWGCTDASIDEVDGDIGCIGKSGRLD